MANNNNDNNEAEVEAEAEAGEIETLQGLPWQRHPMQAFLLERLASNDIPVDYKVMGPFDVWNKYCDNELFEAMECDAAFQCCHLKKQCDKGENEPRRTLKHST